MSKPGPISEILFPSIETEASFTLCNTILTGGSFTLKDLFQAILPTRFRKCEAKKAWAESHEGKGSRERAILTIPSNLRCSIPKLR
jgi:hypothetical protein